jgi:hypothetical protein
MIHLKRKKAPFLALSSSRCLFCGLRPLLAPQEEEEEDEEKESI